MSTDGLGDSSVSTRTWWCATHSHVTKAGSVTEQMRNVEKLGKGERASKGEAAQVRPQMRWKTRGRRSPGGPGGWHDKDAGAVWSAHARDESGRRMQETRREQCSAHLLLP